MFTALPIEVQDRSRSRHPNIRKSNQAVKQFFVHFDIEQKVPLPARPAFRLAGLSADHPRLPAVMTGAQDAPVAPVNQAQPTPYRITTTFALSWSLSACAQR